MKFRLAEQEKFFLEESLTLTEELLLESEAAISVTLQGLFTTTANLNSSLSKDFNLTVIDGTPLKTEKEKIEKELRILRQDIYDLLFGKKKFKEILGPIYDRAKDKALAKIYKYSNTKIGTITDLSKTLSAAIDKLRAQIDKLKYNKIKYNKDNSKEFTNWFENFKKNLIKIKTTLEDLYKVIGVIDDNKETLTVQRVNLAVAFEELFKLSERQAKAFNDNAWNYQAISDDTERISILEQFITRLKAAENVTAPTVQRLWDAYYLWVWTDKADIVKRLGTAFTNQLFTLGFTEKTNDFISFLRYILWTAHIDIAPQAYAAIHNLKLEKKLTAKHLRTVSNDLPKAISMVLCPAVLHLNSGNAAFEIISESIDLLSEIGTELTYVYDEQVRKIPIQRTEQLCILSYVFTNDSKVGDDNKAAICKLLDKQHPDFDAAVAKQFSDIQSSKCFLNSNAKLRDSAAFNVIISDILDGKVVKNKTKKTTLEDETETTKLWDAIISVSEQSKDNMEDFFDYLIQRAGVDTNTYINFAKIVTKGLRGKEETWLNVSDQRIKKLDSYKKVVSDFDINSDSIKKIMKTLFNQIPTAYKANITDTDTDKSGSSNKEAD